MQRREFTTRVEVMMAPDQRTEAENKAFVGGYRSLASFIREAVEEKLVRIRKGGSK